jgi:hypothetical protein
MTYNTKAEKDARTYELFAQLSPTHAEYITPARVQFWIKYGYYYPVAACPVRSPSYMYEGSSWCDNEFGMGQHRQWGRVFGFKSADNAVMFKLRWG